MPKFVVQLGHIQFGSQNAIIVDAPDATEGSAAWHVIHSAGTPHAMGNTVTVYKVEGEGTIFDVAELMGKPSVIGPQEPIAIGSC